MKRIILAGAAALLLGGAGVPAMAAPLAVASPHVTTGNTAVQRVAVVHVEIGRRPPPRRYRRPPPPPRRDWRRR